MPLHKQILQKMPLFIFLGLFFYLIIPLPVAQLSEKKSIQLYANQCDDDIRKCFLSAIKEAKESIVLIVYSLNDPEIFKLLKKKKSQNVNVSIVIDSKNAKDVKEIKDIVTLKDKKSALMHQKILIIDQKKAWIGSANFTASSLQMHDNLVVGIYSPQLAKQLGDEKGGTFFINQQKIEIFMLPKEKKDAYKQVKNLLTNAKESLSVGMFTWTHPDLTQSIIDAKERGVKVSVVLDENSSLGTSKKTKATLISNQVPTKVNFGSPLLHHKCCYIDKQILILGSTNWTKAAFSKNDECLVIIYDLTKEQKKKMEKLWHAMRSTSM